MTKKIATSKGWFIKHDNEKKEENNSGLLFSNTESQNPPSEITEKVPRNSTIQSWWNYSLFNTDVGNHLINRLGNTNWRSQIAKNIQDMHRYKYMAG